MISSLSHSIIFLYFFALITEEGFLISAILWNSAFKWLYLSFSPLLFASLLFTAIFKVYSESHFPFFLLPFLLCSTKVASRFLNIQKHLNLPNLDCLHWNRFKRLDLIECLKNYGRRIVTLETGIKTILKKKKWKKPKWLSEEASKIVV